MKSLPIGAIVNDLHENFLVKFSLILLSLVTPIEAILYTLLALLGANILTCLIATRKITFRYTKQLLSNNFKKAVIYSILALLSYYCQKYLLGDEMKLSVLVTSFICLIEVKEILFHMDIILGTKLFKPLIDKLAALNSVDKPKRTVVDDPDK